MFENSLMGIKEIEEVILRPLTPLTFAGRQYEEHEPIFLFDNLQVMSFKENKKQVSASGGYLNQTRIVWESEAPMDITFSQGTVSALTMAALGNSNLVKGQSTIVPKIEIFEKELESSSNKVKLKFVPVKEPYVYLDGNRLSGNNRDFNYLIEDGAAYIDLSSFNWTPEQTIQVLYDFEYNDVSIMHVGQRGIPGFLELTAKTRLKDDTTGKTVTGIFRVPKLKLMSDFSIRLGEDVPPATSNFRIVAYPTGAKGNETVMDFISLNDDIDSDI